LLFKHLVIDSETNVKCYFIIKFIWPFHFNFKTSWSSMIAKFKTVRPQNRLTPKNTITSYGVHHNSSMVIRYLKKSSSRNPWNLT